MDRESLRSLAASRRSDVEIQTAPVKAQWVCGFCSRTFVRESAFMNHRCREKDRNDELRSTIGLAAYAHYVEWMRLKKHTPPPVETFATSTLYGSFVKFAEYVARVHVPFPKHFIKLMVEQGVRPPLWARDQTYAMYLQWYDNAHSPESQVLESLEFVKELASDMNVHLDVVYEAIGIEDLLKFIRQRKISGWYLFASPGFKKYLGTLSSDQKEALQNAMNAGAMVARIQQKPDLLKFFTKVLTEEGL